MSKRIKKLTGKEDFVLIKPVKKKKKNTKESTQKVSDGTKKGKTEAEKQETKKKVSKKADTLIGIFTGNAKGFGFVTVEGYEEDFFVPASKVKDALHGDEVEIKVLLFAHGGKRAEAEILRVVNRGVTRVVGSFVRRQNFGFVISDNQKIAADIYVPIEDSMGAMDGHKVVVEITKYGEMGRKPEGRIVDILGHLSDPGVDILSLVRAFDIPVEFPKDVMKEAEKIGLTIPEDSVSGRKDFRKLTMVTIDGEDAKDLDDAVSLSRDGEDYLLGVHIADVSEYVKEGYPLDKEAYERGTSVYLTDRVIPMLPRRLSNGICSLNAGEDRLAMSCMMRIGKDGEIQSYEIFESVIHVTRRMNYSDVNAMLHGETMEEYEFIRPMFEEMFALSQILYEKRAKRGCIDFDLPEAKIMLDKKGRPIEITLHEHNDATHLIEEFMLAANESVANYMVSKALPFLYRVHEQPDPEKIRDLQSMARGFGYHLPGEAEDIRPQDIRELIEGIKGRDEEKFISTIALRSMRQARYTNVCLGHFGLACKEYTHFTSPIRRYPDLQIHRILKEELRGELSPKRIAHYDRILESVGDQCSKRERRSVECERETDKLKKAQYMEGFIGESFEGTISGVTNWGFYVELPNTVEGLVPISKMAGDVYVYDEGTYSIKGLQHHSRYTLGDAVTVIMNAVDEQARTIEFVLPLEPGQSYEKESPFPKGKKSKKSAGKKKNSSKKEKRVKKEKIDVRMNGELKKPYKRKK